MINQCHLYNFYGGLLCHATVCCAMLHAVFVHYEVFFILRWICHHSMSSVYNMVSLVNCRATIFRTNLEQPNM